jgi:hypothetical protein
MPTPTKAAASAHTEIQIHCLTELALATTAYHEAPPDRLEEAHLRYQAALRRFKGEQVEVPVRDHRHRVRPGLRVSGN